MKKINKLLLILVVVNAGFFFSTMLFGVALRMAAPWTALFWLVSALIYNYLVLKVASDMGAEEEKQKFIKRLNDSAKIAKAGL